MKQCWSGERLDRPTFTTLHETLQDYFVSDDLNSFIKLQNIDPQSPYYQARRRQNTRGNCDGVDDEVMGRQGEAGCENVSQSQQEGTRPEAEVVEAAAALGGANSLAIIAGIVTLYELYNVLQH